MDDAFCGGPDGDSLIVTDATIPADIISRIAALIWMGDPRNVPGLPYNVGNATAGGVSPLLRSSPLLWPGQRIQRHTHEERSLRADRRDPQFAARPSGFNCPNFSGMIQSYCDDPDPFCAKGNDTATHQGYGQVYGQDALAFVQSKLGA